MLASAWRCRHHASGIFARTPPKENALGTGVNVCFQCEDALALYLRVQITWNSDAGTSVCGETAYVGACRLPIRTAITT